MRQDPRVVRTEASIREAFIRLVEERGFARVSVKDICERADINRNTFYLHFTDKDDLMMRILQGILEAQVAPIASLSSNLSSASPDEVEAITAKILAFFQEEIVFYRIIFTDPALHSYVQKLYHIVFTMVAAGSERPFSPITAGYMIYGFFGVIIAWLKQPTQEISELAPKLSKLLVGSLKEFHEQA